REPRFVPRLIPKSVRAWRKRTTPNLCRAQPSNGWRMHGRPPRKGRPHVVVRVAGGIVRARSRPARVERGARLSASPRPIAGSHGAPAAETRLHALTDLPQLDRA